MPFSLAGAGARDVGFWTPNWIDFRSSLANVDRREDRGETVETCRECGCEADVSPVPHSPKCTALVVAPAAKTDGAKHGLVLLERMDSGEPLRDDEDEDEDEDAPAAVDEPEPEPELEHEPEPEPLAEPEASEPAAAPRAKRRSGELLAEVVAVLERGPQQLAALAEAVGYRSENLGGWLLPHIAAGKIIRVERGIYALPNESGREPQASIAGDGGDRSPSERVASAPETAVVGEPPEPSRPENEDGRRRVWDEDDVVAAIQRWAQQYGHPPTSTEWARRVDGYPTTSTVAARFGSWANAIEKAGFTRPTRGGIPLKPVEPPARRIWVRRTGLSYATPDEAYVAADEIEADGERVAEQARFDGNERKAEQAIDQSRDLAGRIRAAAHDFETRTSGFATSDDVEEPEELAGAAESTTNPFRALARSLIAGMRAASDALEQEIDG